MTPQAVTGCHRLACDAVTGARRKWTRTLTNFRPLRDAAAGGGSAGAGAGAGAGADAYADSTGMTPAKNHARYTGDNYTRSSETVLAWGPSSAILWGFRGASDTDQDKQYARLYL